MRFLFIFLTLFVIGGGGAVWMNSQRPDIFSSLIIGFKPSINAASSADEKKRRSRIALLPISNEKKQFLEQRTIFMGASPDMVQLALGRPREIFLGKNDRGGEQIRWAYQFPNDARPTILQFDGNRLSLAYHTSNYSDPSQPPPAESADAAPPAQNSSNPAKN